MPNDIGVGYQAFVTEGGEEFGAVRAVSRDGREITVYVENAGDFVVPASAVRSIHDEKVVFDADQLDPKLLEAIRHAHDAEDPNW
jgi:hypothetical protein